MRLTPELEALAAGRASADLTALLPPDQDPLLSDGLVLPAPTPPSPSLPRIVAAEPAPELRAKEMPRQKNTRGNTPSSGPVHEKVNRGRKTAVTALVIALFALAAAGFCLFFFLQARHELDVLALKLEKSHESIRKEVDDKIMKALQDATALRPAPTLADVEALSRELDTVTTEILNAKPGALPAAPQKQNALNPAQTKKTKGTWIVNIVSEKSKDKLKATAERLRKAGLAPEFVEVRIAGTTWHRLRIKNYPSREQALAHSAEISKKFGIPSVWVDEM